MQVVPIHCESSLRAAEKVPVFLYIKVNNKRIFNFLLDDNTKYVCFYVKKFQSIIGVNYSFENINFKIFTKFLVFDFFSSLRLKGIKFLQDEK